jgi:hypothetical protein
MADLYNLRFFIASWLWSNDSGQPMIWFIKHFNSFEFNSEQEAKEFIMTFAYIHTVYFFEGFILKADEDAGYLAVEDFIRMHEGTNDEDPLSDRQLSNCQIVKNNLKTTFLILFNKFGTPRNLFRELVSMNIENDVPNYTAYRYLHEKALEYGFEDEMARPNDKRKRPF